MTFVCFDSYRQFMYHSFYLSSLRKRWEIPITVCYTMFVFVCVMHQHANYDIHICTFIFIWLIIVLFCIWRKAAHILWADSSKCSAFQCLNEQIKTEKRRDFLSGQHNESKILLKLQELIFFIFLIWLNWICFKLNYAADGQQAHMFKTPSGD